MMELAVPIRKAIGRISEAIEEGRKQRDAVEEQLFRMLCDVRVPAAPTAAGYNGHSL